jgi:phage/plasmid-like protein (TIGR03299 family)
MMPDAVETMAYNKAEVPWHGLGEPVDGNLTPYEMARKARVDWEVKLVPSYIEVEGVKIPTGDSSLIRVPDCKILTNVSAMGWNPVQNMEAWEFFNEFCEEGGMSMETMGSLKGGQLVWALARINQAFSLFRGKDVVNGFMLFTNPHLYGWSTSVSFTAIRVVCWNTLNLSLNSTKGDKIVKVSHRREFIAEQVKDALGVSRQKLKTYKEAAELLSSVKAPKEDVVEYFKRLFPVLTDRDDAKVDISRGASKCLEVLDTQPGAEYGRGTWWQSYNAATYYMDHLAGRSVDSRLTSAWYGAARKTKVKALEVACEMAS